MVTITEARQQITQSRQQIQQQQSRINETRREIEQARLPQLTRQELQVRGREEVRQRKIRVENLEALKKQKLSELKPFQEQIAISKREITKFESTIKKAEAEDAVRARFQDILSRIARGRPIPPGTTGKEVERAEKILEPFRQRTVTSLDLQKAGITTIISKERQEITQQELDDIRKAGLDVFSPKILKKLGVGVIIGFKEAQKKEDVKISPPPPPPFTPLLPVDQITIPSGTGSATRAVDIGGGLMQDFHFKFKDGQIVEGSGKLIGISGLQTKRFKEKQKEGLGLGGIFFKPGERADLRTFVPTEELDIKKITAKDILTRSIFFEEPKIIPLKVQEWGANAQKEIQKFKRKVLIAALPSVKAEFEKQEKEANKIKGEFEKLDSKIVDFNEKFGQAGLSEAQFKEATRQQDILNKNVDSFEKLITDTEIAQRDRLTEKNKLKPGLSTAAEGFLIGVFSAPFDFTSFIIGGVTQPKRNLLGFNVEIQSLPSQFAQAPFGSAGFLAGQILVQSKLANLALKGVKKGGIKIGKGGKLFFNIKKINAGNSVFQKILKSQKRLLKDKRGVAFSEAAQILSKKKKKKKKKGELSPEEALAEFARSFRKRQIDIIEAAFKERIRAGGRISKTELKRSIQFMRKAGLKETDIGFILAEIFRRQELQRIRGSFRRGDISKTAFNQRKTRLINLKQQLVRKQRRIKIIEANIEQLKPLKLKAPKKVQEKLIVKQKKILKQPKQQRLQAKQKLLLKQRMKFRQVQRTKTLQIQKASQKFLVLQARATTQTQRTKLANMFKQAQQTLQKSIQKEGLKLLTLTLQVAKLRGASPTALKSISRQRSKLFKPTKVGKVPKLIIKPKVKETLLTKAVQKLGKKGVDIVVGLQVGKRKTIAKNLPKWKALRKAQKFVDTNIQASFVLKKSGKIAKGKDIKPFSPSFKFRSSKTNPLFQVERRKFRLDSPREVSQLKAFKGKVPKGFFPTKRKGRKKK